MRKLSTRGKNYFRFVILLSFFFVATTHATTITQTQNFGGTPNLLQLLTFNQFDDQGGSLILQSIEVTFSLDITGGSLTLDNDGQLPANGTFEFGADGDISSTDVSLLNTSFQPITAGLEATHIGAFALTANAGDGSGDFDPTPTDGMQYIGTNENDSDSGFITPAVFVGYIGTGTYDIVVDAIQWSSFGGVSGIE